MAVANARKDMNSDLAALDRPDSGVLQVAQQPLIDLGALMTSDGGVRPEATAQ
jgi:hypothetical protein